MRAWPIPSTALPAAGEVRRGRLDRPQGQARLLRLLGRAPGSDAIERHCLRGIGSPFELVFRIGSAASRQRDLAVRRTEVERTLVVSAGCRTRRDPQQGEQHRGGHGRGAAPSAFGSFSAFLALLANGRRAVAERLTQLGYVDAESLPLRRDFLDYLERRSGLTALGRLHLAAPSAIGGVADAVARPGSASS